jgi:DNA-binding NarL/FixJ family response regulator
MLESHEGIRVVGEARRWALETSAEAVDVIVMDVDPDAESIADSIEDAGTDSAIVLLADSPEAYQELPADGRPAAYLLRSAGSEEVVAALQAVARGLVVLDPVVAMPGPRAANVSGDGIAQLTEREMEVLRLLALGLPNKGIALQLGISEHTVKFHVGSILSRLNAASRTEAVMLAARRGLLPL